MRVWEHSRPTVRIHNSLDKQQHWQGAAAAATVTVKEDKSFIGEAREAELSPQCEACLYIPAGTLTSSLRNEGGDTQRPLWGGLSQRRRRIACEADWRWPRTQQRRLSVLGLLGRENTRREEWRGSPRLNTLTGKAVHEGLFDADEPSQDGLAHLFAL